MANVTISEGMVLQRTIRSRMMSLERIRNANLTNTRTFSYLGGGEPKEKIEVEPKYDPRIVDKKLTELELFLFKLDSAIKRANAKTEISVEADIEKLLEPIQ